MPDMVQTGWQMPGIQVMQILAHPLQSRARLFPRLPSHSQVYPGFFDAPGSACALLPHTKHSQDMLQKQAVTIAFCSADKSALLLPMLPAPPAAITLCAAYRPCRGC